MTKIIAVDVSTYNKLIDRSDLLTVPESQIPKVDGYKPSSSRPKGKVELKVKTPIKEEEEINVTDSPEKVTPEVSTEKVPEKEAEVKPEIKEEPEEQMEVDEMPEAEKEKEKSEAEKEKEKSGEAKPDEPMEVVESDKAEVKEEKVEEPPKSNEPEKKEGESSSQPQTAAKEPEVKVENAEEAKPEPKAEPKTTEAKPDAPKEGTFNKSHLKLPFLNILCSGGSSSSGHRLLVFRPVCEFEEIDISKALNMPGRLAYPKVAKPSKLDEFYQRRLQLKAVEERNLAVTAEVRVNLHFFISFFVGE